MIFDLDGTITRPYLDFAAIRAEASLDASQPILEQMEKLDAARRAQVQAILERHEEEAARNSELHDGAKEVLAALHRRGIALALLTRNSRRSVAIVLKKHRLAFDFVRTREDGALKPSAEPVRAICAALDVTPQQTLMVGDYLFDIQAGAAAGTATALMIGEQPPPAFAHQADYVIRRLDEIPAIVDTAVADIETRGPNSEVRCPRPDTQ
ncbi:MAG: HAD family hydrolase [Phycisphaerae bacterium]